MNPRAPVSVVIPTRNGGDRFRECLVAVGRQEIDRPLELVCIDSGSRDGTVDHARAFGARVMRVDPRDFNHGGTRNQAIAATRGEYVALLTQDAVPTATDWLASLVAALETTPRAAGVYGRQVARAGLNPCARWRLEQWAATRAMRVVQEVVDHAAFEAASPLAKLALAAFDNVNSCVRRSAWARMPFPCVRFGEDVAWGLEAIRCGYALVYEPRACVEHSHDDSLWRDFKRVYADHRNLRRLFGVHQVPTLRHLMTCTVSGAGAMWREVERGSYSRAQRAYWRCYAIGWTLVQNAAQYLGARAGGRAGRPPWRWVDALVSD